MFNKINDFCNLFCSHHLFWLKKQFVVTPCYILQVELTYSSDVFRSTHGCPFEIHWTWSFTMNWITVILYVVNEIILLMCLGLQNQNGRFWKYSCQANIQEQRLRQKHNRRKLHFKRYLEGKIIWLISLYWTIT